MSRLTASPFHRPSPYEVLNAVHPLSPPETNSDYVGPVLTSASMPVTVPVVAEPDFDHTEVLPSATITETSGSHIRRTSSLTYNNTNLRESRDRSVPKSPKPLLVVIPPLALVRERGQLGHTLSSGPPHRLSQGILMPLFPTVYTQLTAIAREFNFPSTAGLCLYLHYSDGGIAVMPRISDDVWLSIWGGAFESYQPNSVITLPQFNIWGRIEFDIDFHQARWYASWLSSSRRGSGDVPISIDISHPAHFRLDSRTTNNEEQAIESRSDSVSAGQAQKISVPIPSRRHIPKKLSLVDRFDAFSMPSGSKLAEPALSPIVQEDEPKTAKLALERRVNSWIAGASFTPSPLASKIQTTLEPSDMQNSPPVPQELPQDTYGSELNLDEFDWSVSSLGPCSCDSPSTSSSQYRLPSVHLANRIEGSVDLTPSVCTSFGPSDYEVYPALSIGILTPFVDLGQCMVEDVPLTPSTATSWGPPSWPVSPLSDPSAKSINLGDRGEWSLPATPSTATSWGAPLHYPSTPSTPYYITTPDLGQRAFDPSSSIDTKSTVPPSAPWVQVWPYYRSGSGNERERELSMIPQPSLDTLSVEDSKPSSAPTFTLPYHNAGKGTPWAHVWPYCRRGSGDEREGKTSRLPAGNTDDRCCSSLNASTHEDTRTRSLVFPYYGTRNARPWLQVWPYLRHGSQNEGLEISKNLRESASSLRPLSLEGSSGYPHFDIYPVKTHLHNTQLPLIDIMPSVQYPIFDLYPAVHPQGLTPCPTQSQYPDFNIYPAIAQFDSAHGGGDFIYPHFNIYPAINLSAGDNDRIGTTLDQVSLTNRFRESAVYPQFNLYPAVYPYFDLYPEAPPSQLDNIRTEALLVETICHDSHPVVLGYPYFELYPASCSNGADDSTLISTNWDAEYPTFNLYPAVYPYFDLYPDLARKAGEMFEDVPKDCADLELDGTRYSQSDSQHDCQWSEARTSTTTRVKASYPAFDLYYPVYPHFQLWPPILEQVEPQCASTTSDEKPIITVRLPASYPAFDLYPPVYPYFDLWCSSLAPVDTHHAKKSEEQAPITVRLTACYPAFDLYPPVYPHFDLWPSSLVSVDTRPVIPRSEEETRVTVIPRSEETCVTIRLKANYPAFDLYPPVYPHFEFWPSLPSPASPWVLTRDGKETKKARKTHYELWQMVHADGVGSTVNRPAPSRRISKTHVDLHLSVFPDGNVTTPSGTIRESSLPQSSLPLQANGVIRADPLRALPQHVSIVEARVHGTRSRSGSVSVRPVSDVPSVAKKLPVLPTPRRTSTTSSLLSSTPDVQPRPRKLPPIPSNARAPPTNRRFSNLSNARSVTECIPERLETSALSPIKERRVPSPSSLRSGTSPTWNKPSSPPFKAASSPVARFNSLSGTSPVSPLSPPKRDSLVQNRIKGYSSNSSPSDSQPMNFPDALTRFPMPPPTIPQVPVVSKLDRSKFPFAEYGAVRSLN